jgi:predicted permease
VHCRRARAAKQRCRVVDWKRHAPHVQPRAIDASDEDDVTNMHQDVVHACRQLRRHPGFALLAALTMALGTGAVTVLCALTYSVLLRPLPWRDSDALVRITESRAGHAPRIQGTISNAAYLAWHDAHDTIDAIGGWRNTAATVVAGNGEPLRLQTAAITPSLLTVLQQQPLLGRPFVDEDGREGSTADLVLLSYGLWQEQFGGRADVLDRVVQIDSRPHTIVGVMPREFAFPDRSVRAWTVWSVPTVIGPGNSRRVAIFSAMARLRAGVSAQQASAEGTLRARSAPDPGLAAVAMFGSSGPADITATPAIEQMTAELRPALLILVAAVVLLLATSTANVASLQLARTSTRRREIAIRAALGAPAGRLTRQLVIESVVISGVGGLAGLAFAAAVTAALPRLLPPDFPRLDDIAVDGRVVVASVAVALIAGVACSVVPAWHVRRLDVTGTLADGAAAAAGGFLRSPTMRARTAIITAQIAVACVLLTGAALLSRSFVALMQSDRGYDARNLLTARLALPPDFPAVRRADLLQAIVERMHTAPGVRDVAYGNALPLLSGGMMRVVTMRPPIDPTREVDMRALQRVVSARYFQALGLRVVQGRALAATDTAASEPVIVVNRSFAARYLGPSALGVELPLMAVCRDDSRRRRVVGVVEDMRQSSVTDDPQPEFFVPDTQAACAEAMPEPIVVVRTEDDPLDHAATLRAVLREHAPAAALDSLMTMDARVAQTLARPRLYALALAGFAAFSLIIAAAGLFGVLSYSVAQRSREFGVRTALGAAPGDLLSLVLRQVVAMTVVGIGAGAWIAFAAARWIAAILYGIEPHDPVSFAAVGATLLVVIALASLVPVWRAARIDPVEALRAG